MLSETTFQFFLEMMTSSKSYDARLSVTSNSQDEQTCPVVKASKPFNFAFNNNSGPASHLLPHGTHEKLGSKIAMPY
jgi:hypothetical protein